MRVCSFCNIFWRIRCWESTNAAFTVRVPCPYFDCFWAGFAQQRKMHWNRWMNESRAQKILSDVGNWLGFDLCLHFFVVKHGLLLRLQAWESRPVLLESLLPVWRSKETRSSSIESLWYEVRGNAFSSQSVVNSSHDVGCWILDNSIRWMWQTCVLVIGRVVYWRHVFPTSQHAVVALARTPCGVIVWDACLEKGLIFMSSLLYGINLIAVHFHKCTDVFVHRTQVTEFTTGSVLCILNFWHWIWSQACERSLWSTPDLKNERLQFSEW